MSPNFRRLAARSLSALALLGLACGIAVAGSKAYVGNFADNTVSVIDLSTRKTVATIPVAAGPHGMAVSADGSTVYVSGDASSDLSVIDAKSDAVRKTIPVGKAPNGLALTPDGKSLLVTIYGEDRVVFLDTGTLERVASVAVPKPHTVSIRPDGRLAYVSSQQPGHFALVVIDLATRQVARSLPLAKTPRDAEFSFDGQSFYFTQAGVAAVQVLDPASDNVVASIPTGASPHVAVRLRGMDAGLVVVQGPGELLMFDPAANRAMRNIHVGKQPHWLAGAADGKTVYVTNEGSNDVSVIDVAGAAVTDTIAVGRAPRKIVVPQREPEAGARPALVSIAGFSFEPAQLEVHAGQQVRWSNDDGAIHAVSFKDASAGAVSLEPGKSFDRTFDRPGSYEYFCAFHPYMTGRIVVLAP